MLVLLERCINRNCANIYEKILLCSSSGSFTKEPKMQVLTIEQLSKLIHKSVSSIRSDRVRNPKSLPPSFTLPQSRRVLFKNVDAWLDSLAQSQAPAVQPESVISAKRGRPTLASKINVK